MMEKLKKIKYGFISMRRTAGMISLCFIKNKVTGDEIWLQFFSGMISLLKLCYAALVGFPYDFI